jgi:hypothetical protein
MKRERWIIASDALGTVGRDVWHPDTPEETAEAWARTLNAKPKGWGILDELSEIRSLVDAGLDGMGWPASCVRLAVSKDKADWGAFGQGWRVIERREEVGDGEMFRWSFLWIEGAAPALSEAYFLGKMAFSLQAIEDHLEKDDLLTVFHHSMRLGLYQSEIDVRRIALRYAETGKDIHQGSRRGNDMKSAGSFKARHGAAAQARAFDLLAEKPDRTWSKIRDLLAEEFGVSAETIKKSVRNPKKNG